MSDEFDLEAAQVYLLEAGELLAQIEETALAISPRPDQATANEVNLLFRAFHTIKGSGAMFGFEAVARFTHHVESMLDDVRGGELLLSTRLVELLLAAKDHIKVLLDARLTGGGEEDETTRNIVTALQEIIARKSDPTPPVAVAVAPALPVAAPARAEISSADLREYRIRFRPIGTWAKDFDPTSLLAELRKLGSCDLSEPQAAGQSSSEHWNFALTAACEVQAVRDTFFFVDGQFELGIEVAGDAAKEAPTPSLPPISGAVAPVKAATTTTPAAARKTTTESVVRVSSEKLDRLVSLVGEMVMNQSRLGQVAATLGAAELAGPVEALERLVAEMRDSVLGIRMMPIGSTFSRFKRLVHDLSRDLGKEIALVTEGEETELDKTVLDQLGDPLVHLIRNSIDHGIESPGDRVRAGKPRGGTIRLTAAHEGAQVVVMITDDGKGLDIERIRAKAIAKRLIGADAVLSEQEIFKLIFLPGFSTAETVTSVSGRGVGMDVVRKQLDALRGDIRIESKVGQGTTVRLTLPLTLAIIDGLLVGIGPDQFIIPMAAVTENVELTAAERQRNNGRNLLTVRGELVPYLRLREVFEIRGDESGVEKVVIVSHVGQRVGLVVDRVLGSHQTVIQPLGQFYRDIGVVSGSTIMGDGRVALIFDVAGLIAFAERQVRFHRVSVDGLHDPSSA